MNKIVKTGIVCAASAVIGSVIYLVYRQKKEEKEFESESSDYEPVFRDYEQERHDFINSRREAMKARKMAEACRAEGEPHNYATVTVTSQSEEAVDSEPTVEEKVEAVKEAIEEAKTQMAEEGVTEPTENQN